MEDEKKRNILKKHIRESFNLIRKVNERKKYKIYLFMWQKFGKHSEFYRNFRLKIIFDGL